MVLVTPKRDANLKGSFDPQGLDFLSRTKIAMREYWCLLATNVVEEKQLTAKGLCSPALRLSFPLNRRILSTENCCVVSGLAKHTSGRKPTF